MRTFMIGFAVALAAMAGGCSSDGEDDTSGATASAGSGSTGGVGGNGGDAAGSGGSTGSSGGSGGLAGSSGSGGSGGSSPFDCAICQVAELDCATPAGPLGTATLGNPTDTGCSGTISAGDEAAPLWIHCDTATICVEHVDECFDASATATSFSYDIPSKYVITCTAK